MCFGLFAPASTPTDVIAKLNTEVNKVLAQPEVKKRLGEFGLTASTSKPADLDRLIAENQTRFGPLVKALAITAN